MCTLHENPEEIHILNIEYSHVPTGVGAENSETKKDVFSVLEKPMSGKEDRPTRSLKRCLTWLLPQGLSARVPVCPPVISRDRVLVCVVPLLTQGPLQGQRCASASSAGPVRPPWQPGTKEAQPASSLEWRACLQNHGIKNARSPELLPWVTNKLSLFLTGGLFILLIWPFPDAYSVRGHSDVTPLSKHMFFLHRLFRASFLFYTHSPLLKFVLPRLQFFKNQLLWLSVTGDSAFYPSRSSEPSSVQRNVLCTPQNFIHTM